MEKFNFCKGPYLQDEALICGWYESLRATQWSLHIPEQVLSTVIANFADQRTGLAKICNVAKGMWLQCTLNIFCILKG